MLNTIKKTAIITLAAVCLLVSLSGCQFLESTMPPATTTATTTPPIPTTSVNPTWVPPGQSSGLELANWTEAVHKVKPGVVSIETESASGSGWIVDGQGIIVTNYHVIEGAGEVSVILDDGTYYPAENIASDPVTDLAVIFIDATGLPVPEVGTSAGLEVGQPVAAVGNALGLGVSMKGGWVSRLGVYTVIDGRGLYGLVETDAAVNPGNSGGPLINLAGEIVGITNAKLVDVTIEGVGYAISIDSALPIISELIQTGTVAHPFMGVQGLHSVNRAIANFYDLSVNEGVLILAIVPDSGAEAAGLEGGDVILAIDGESTPSVDELVRIIRSKEVGQTVSVELDREGARMTVELELGEYPDS